MTKKHDPADRPMTREEQGAFFHALSQEGQTKKISDIADQQCFLFLDELRRGDLVRAERALDELERLYTYGGTCPSRDGFRNLCHVVRQLLTRHALTTPQESRAIPDLVAIGEAYDPSRHQAPHSKE